MKNTLKALAIVLAPVFVTLCIFNATVMKAYTNAKKLENNRSPAIITTR